jgi:S-adenosylmethionine decarboxylase
MDLVNTFFNESVEKHGLTKVGEVYFKFDDSGYTATICLTESHISIHTWPEYNMVTFDVFLSNYQNVNNKIAEHIHENLLQLLEATSINTHRINR